MKKAQANMLNNNPVEITAEQNGKTFHGNFDRLQIKAGVFCWSQFIK
ncbi:MAG TPA: hypothetical protein VIS49_01490 [Cyclobacteriaceae bacterium]